MASEDMAFGDGVLLIRVCGKIFAALSLDGKNRLVIKCDAAYAQELRDHHPEIEAAYHWNKKYWNQLDINCGLPGDFIKSLVRHSYIQVVGKLPNKIKSGNPEILTVAQ